MKSKCNLIIFKAPYVLFLFKNMKKYYLYSGKKRIYLHFLSHVKIATITNYLNPQI